MTMCAAAIFFTACTNELEENTLSSDALVLTVGDYPVFSEGLETRAVGTFDPGKTAWENGDKVLIRVSSNGSVTQYATLTYNGTTWTATPTLTRPTDNYTVNAWYAPAYEWGTNNTLTLISGGQAGTDEFLTTTSTTSSIDFSNATRNYSRLRFVSSTNTSLTVTLSNFNPAGGNATNNYRATLTTDSKGNAYLYGSWSSTPTLTVNADYLDNGELSKSLTSFIASKSYAVDTPKMINTIPSSWNGSTTNITGYYKLTADITLTENWTPIGNATTNTQEGRFIGTFDGNGHTIRNLTYSANTNDFGLFRVIGSNGVVRNLKLENCSISGSGDTYGGIVGTNYGTIENCHVSGSITGGNDVGGIVGSGRSPGLIIACSNSATINGTDNVGGIEGASNGTNMISCCNTGTVTGTTSYVGGISGWPRSSAKSTTCYFSAGNNNSFGTYTASWTQEVVNSMNVALQQNGYDYQYELDGGKPVINNP